MGQWDDKMRFSFDLQKAFQNQPKKLALIQGAEAIVREAVRNNRIRDIGAFLDKLPLADSEFLAEPLEKIGVTAADLGIGKEAFQRIVYKGATPLSIIRQQVEDTQNPKIKPPNSSIPEGFLLIENLPP